MVKLVLVAPLVGAWIEISKRFINTAVASSLPSWERGLKSALSYVLATLSGSLPSWERGLKYSNFKRKL